MGIRASHVLYANMPLWEDPFAYALCNWSWRLVLSSRFTKRLLFDRLLNGLEPIIAQVLVRSRYAEDRLAAARGRGINQYVILSAGLDSFALRHANDEVSFLKIFELDQADTQAMKRRRIQHRHLTLPSNLEFVAIDFEHETVSTALENSGYRHDAPAFFSWLGTTHYLSPQATMQTLLSIAKFAAPGSEVVLDYSIPPELLDLDRHPELVWLAKRTERLGEPIIGNIAPEVLNASVHNMGFEVVEDLSGDDQTQRYCFGRSDHLAPTPACRLLHLRLQPGNT